MNSENLRTEHYDSAIQKLQIFSRNKKNHNQQLIDVVDAQLRTRLRLGLQSLGLAQKASLLLLMI
jgi:hypothetical protein